MKESKHFVPVMKQKKNWSRTKKREMLIGWIFLSPALIFFLIFVLYPMLRGIYISFFEWGNRSFDFVGITNYTKLLADDVFRQSMINTIVLVVVTVPVVIIFALFVSTNIYNRSSRVRSFFRGVFYLPAISSIVSITVVWLWIYHPQYGVLNYILQSTKVIGEPVAWLGQNNTALLSIIVVLITTSVGQPIILYIAALGNIPKSYREAASIDGASDTQIFRKITWPLLMPTTLYVTVTTTIATFQCFSLIQLMTSGGPNYKTSTVMYLIYEKAFTLQQYGYAAAMGIILAIIIGIISLVQFKFFGNEVDY